MGTLKTPAPESSYGHLRVTGPPFRAPGKKLHGVMYDAWWVPCECDCGSQKNIRWDNLWQGTATRCRDCKSTADATRLQAIGYKRTAVKWRWYHKGDSYLYAIYYATVNVLKIGFSTGHPGNTIRSSDARYFKYTGKELKGEMVWHQPGTLEDEAIIQGMCSKHLGGTASFSSRKPTRAGEWIGCANPDVALAYIKEAYDYSTRLPSARLHFVQM
jgi:hypothetical protein